MHVISMISEARWRNQVLERITGMKRTGMMNDLGESERRRSRAYVSGNVGFRSEDIDRCALRLLSNSGAMEVTMAALMANTPMDTWCLSFVWM
jgi:hypothetical protein